MMRAILIGLGVISFVGLLGMIILGVELVALRLGEEERERGKHLGAEMDEDIY